MGIRGLTTLMSQWPDIADKIHMPIQSPDNKNFVNLIMDGSALMYMLYFSRGLSCACGGQYEEFAVIIREYVVGLQNCGFSLFLVFDGLSPDAKLKEEIRRQHENIDLVWKSLHPKDVPKSSKALNTIVDPKVLPILANTVFIQTITEIGVKFVICDDEADAVVASMAASSGCVACSKDSDFYIYNIPAGYVPFDHLKVTSRGASALRFNFTKLAAKLGIHPAQLPMLATLSGNDFVSQSILQNFHRRLAELYPVSEEERETLTSRHCTILGVAKFLKGFAKESDAIQSFLDITFPASEVASVSTEIREDEEASADASAASVEASATTLISDKRDHVESIIRDSLRHYSRIHSSKVSSESSLILAFSRLELTSLAEKCDTELNNKELRDWRKPAVSTAVDGGERKRSFPSWVLKSYREGRFPDHVMNVLVRSRMWCGSRIENLNEVNSCWLLSRPLRQSLYKIILGSIRDETPCVREFLRSGKQFISEIVPMSSLSLLNIFDVENASVPDRLSNLMLGIIGTAASQAVIDSLLALPQKWILPIAALRAFIHLSSSPKIHSWEIIVIIATFARNRPTKKHAHENKVPSWLSLEAIQRMAEWQCILLCSMWLNASLQMPLEYSRPSDVFDGMYTHRFYREAEKRKNLTVSDFLQRADVDNVELFWTLYHAVTIEMNDSNIIGGLLLGGDSCVNLSKMWASKDVLTLEDSSATDGAPSNGTASMSKNLFDMLEGDNEDNEDNEDNDNELEEEGNDEYVVEREKSVDKPTDELIPVSKPVSKKPNKSSASTEDEEIQRILAEIDEIEKIKESKPSKSSKKKQKQKDKEKKTCKK